MFKQFNNFNLLQDPFTTCYDHKYLGSNLPLKKSFEQSFGSITFDTSIERFLASTEESKSNVYTPLDHHYNTCYEDVFPSILSSKDLASHDNQFSNTSTIINPSITSPPPSPLYCSDSDTPSHILAPDSPCTQFLGSPLLQKESLDKSFWSSHLLFGNIQPQPVQDTLNKKKSAKRSKIHTCPYCKHTSNRANNMREHVLIHDPNRPKPFCCNLCDRAFARKHDMKRHVDSCKRRLDKRQAL